MSLRGVERRVADEYEREDRPVTDNGEVVLDALVVDVRIGLEKRHGDLGGPDRLSGGGHACGQPLERPLGRSRLGGEVEHVVEGVEGTTRPTTTRRGIKLWAAPAGAQ